MSGLAYILEIFCHQGREDVLKMIAAPPGEESEENDKAATKRAAEPEADNKGKKVKK